MKVILAIFTVTLIATGIMIYRDQIMKALNYQDYDMYVFALQWGPTYCLGASDTENKSCQEALTVIPKNHVSIHGLWPSLQSGAYLQECNQGTEVKIVDDGSTLFTNMKKYWPTLSSNTNEYFWGHEYNKHGYCYSEYIGNYDYKKYFQKTFDVFNSKKLNTLIIDVFGSHSGEYAVAYDQFSKKLEAKFGGKYFSLVCKQYNKKYYISEIRLNLDMNFTPFKNNVSNTCKSGQNIIILYR